METNERDPYLWKQAKARAGFKMHLRSFLIINAGLWLIWLVMSLTLFDGHPRAQFPWPIWATLGWGIGLTSHYVSVYRGQDARSLAEKEYQKLTNAGR